MADADKIKECITCHVEKELNETNFYFRKDNGKFRNECKTCVCEQRKKYALENPEIYKITRRKTCLKNIDKRRRKNKLWRTQNKQYRKDYVSKNKDLIKSIQKRAYDKNREVILEKGKLYYHNNTDKYKKWRDDYAANNKDKLRMARRKWENERMSSDENYKLAKTLRARIREALKYVGGKAAKTAYLIGCDVGTLKKHLESQFTEGMNWGTHGVHGWHIDHKKPVSWFDLTKEEEMLQAFHYTNLQPLWSNENILKNNKYAHT